MINKPSKSSKSLALLNQRFSRFIVKMPQNILLRYNIWVEIFLVILGGVIASYILISFIINQPGNGQDENNTYQTTVTLSGDTIDSVNEWIQAREAGRGNSSLSSSLFD